MNNTEIILKQIASIVNAVENGTADGLDAFIELKKIEKKLSGAIDSVFETAFSDASKYGTGEHLRNGVIFSVRPTAGRWDFKGCQMWIEQKSQLENVEKHLKSLVSSRQIGDPIVDHETGEIIQLPTFNAGKETIFLKIPKM
jgi:hypothetical protein